MAEAEIAKTPTGPRGPLSLFVTDVRRTVGIWKREPRLPVVAAGIAMLIVTPCVIGSDTGQLWLAVPWLAVLIFFAGFYGTVRVWYVQVDRGLPFSWRDFRTFNGALRRRFVRLGLFAASVVLLLMWPVLAATNTGSSVRVIVGAPILVVLDVALTFATVGLAFNDGTAREAVRHSLHVLRTEWPQCAWYALTPALTLHVVAQLLPRSTLGLPVRLGLDLLTAVFALLCKGATVLFYSDRYPTLDDVTSARLW